MTSLPDGITRDTLHGFDVLQLRTPFSTAALSLQGGQLLSFLPEGLDDLLWVSPNSARPPKAIRGGVPVCWPYFGRDGQDASAPQHGHARLTRWQLDDARREDDGALQLKLSLPLHPGVPLQLAMTVHVGRELRQSIDTQHLGDDAPYTLTQALHSYFRVADARQARVHGLDGLDYDDKYDGATHRQHGEWSLQDPRDPGRSDRIYAGTGHRFDLLDPAGGRRIRLDTFGSRSLVVWNPGADGARDIADLPHDGWQHFICLEAANAGADRIELEPGQRHRLSQVITASPL